MTEDEKLLMKLRDADVVMKTIDEAVKDGWLDSRSKIADARLHYGQPFIYEWLSICRNCPEHIYWPNCDPSIFCPYQNGEDGDTQWLRKKLKELVRPIHIGEF